MANAKFQTPTPINEPVKDYAPGSLEKRLLVDKIKSLKSERPELPLVIGGKKIHTKQTDAILCPHDLHHAIGSHSHAGKEEISAAIESAVAARAGWAALPWEERAAVFLRAAELLAGKYRAEMNAATMLGQSKTVHQAEIDAACELIDFFRFNVHFAERIYEEQPFSPPGQWNRLVARGLEGFVFAVAPFNFTSISVNLPCAPALMGCSVLWKPAHTGVYSSYVAMRILEEAGLPPGVINLVTGSAPMIADAALAHPQLAGIHFTGSTGTFNQIWQTIGTNLDRYKSYPRLVGETGGKDFVFAHPSADVDTLVTALVRGAFEYQGQKCSAASRAYIPTSLWPKVKEKLVATTNEIPMGNPEDFSNFIGAVIDKKAYDRITGYIEHARAASDAAIIAGGQHDCKDGYFIRPTIIEAKNPTYRSMTEEIFGPVLSVYIYADVALEDTLRICDESTPYALTGAIFAQDRRDVARLTERLEGAAGNFYINDKPTGAVVGQQPFGGGRKSGTNDKAGSIFNLLRWVSHRTIKENFLPVTDYRYPFMGKETPGGGT